MFLQKRKPNALVQLSIFFLFIKLEKNKGEYSKALISVRFKSWKKYLYQSYLQEISVKY